MGSVLKVKETPINGLTVVETKPHADERGTFSRFFCQHDLSPILGSRKIVQINQSKTFKVGTVRGMHFQYPPNAEMKLVRCLKGQVWDVAVDLRPDSPTFLKWHSEVLSFENARMMVIPEGFAHGFQVMEPESELLYLHSAFYSLESEGGLRHDDPSLGILWPITVTELSHRDSNHPFIKSDFRGLQI